MDQSNEISIAVKIKEGRLSKGYTQQELSDLTGISIRSVQRIENGEVTPREYTLRLLAEKLELKDLTLQNSLPDDQRTAAPFDISTPPVSRQLNKPRKIILSTGIGLFLILSISAFIAQSPRFPETAFEAFCLWSVVTLVYTVILFRLWK